MRVIGFCCCRKKFRCYICFTRRTIKSKWFRAGRLPVERWNASHVRKSGLRQNEEDQCIRKCCPWRWVEFRELNSTKEPFTINFRMFHRSCCPRWFDWSIANWADFLRWIGCYVTRAITSRPSTHKIAQLWWVLFFLLPWPSCLCANNQLFSSNFSVLIPHLGSATWKTRNDMAALAAQNILNGLAGKPLVYSAF